MEDLQAEPGTARNSRYSAEKSAIFSKDIQHFKDIKYEATKSVQIKSLYIQRHLSQSMAVCGRLWQTAVICGSLWQFVAVFGGVQYSVAVSGSIWHSVTVCGIL